MDNNEANIKYMNEKHGAVRCDHAQTQKSGRSLYCVNKPEHTGNHRHVAVAKGEGR